MKKIIPFIGVFLISVTVQARHIIEVSPVVGDATEVIREAVSKASSFKGKPVTVKFAPATYMLSRKKSDTYRYFGSNTTTESENNDVTKHIGIWLKDLENVIIEGNGARFVADGELTAFAVDGCRNIRFEGFSLDALVPTVAEMTVTAVDDRGFTARVHSKSKYDIADGKLFWKGNGWRFGSGIAQIYDPVKNITWRDYNPQISASKILEIEPGLLYFYFGKTPKAVVGQVFQMRDGVRDEIGFFVVNSKDVSFKNVHFSYLGNFSLLCQFTENVSLENVYFEPEQGSGRTNACFADFFHLSGCKGVISVNNCRFTGAHDDPINVHGTHLLVTEYLAKNKIKVRFMHGQTYGMDAFFTGDKIEFIQKKTLIPAVQNEVKAVNRISDREIILTLKDNLPETIMDSKPDDYVIENTTCTPELYVRNTYFSRIPTRGILVSTRKKVVIEDNVFDGMQMSAVLIADDAMSWYESGYVRDVTIRRNKFVNCGEPVIFIAPENHENGGCVHKNITIDGNIFIMTGTRAIDVSYTDGLTVKNNLFLLKSDKDFQAEDFVTARNCENVALSSNRVEKYD